LDLDTIIGKNSKTSDLGDLSGECGFIGLTSIAQGEWGSASRAFMLFFSGEEKRGRVSNNNHLKDIKKPEWSCPNCLTEKFSSQRAMVQHALSCKQGGGE